MQRPNGRGSAAPAIEERYTTIASIEEQPRRECDDNYAEVDEPAKKMQLWTINISIERHLFTPLQGISEQMNLLVLLGASMEEQTQ